MEFADSVKAQFEFITRRAVTEAATNRAAACRYDSADDNDEEELALSGEYFDLNMLPDGDPQDLCLNPN